MTLSIDVLGADGSEWHLLDPTSGVQLPGGITGLQRPATETQWAQAARIPGRRRRGATVSGRELTMRVHVGDLRRPYRVDADWRLLDAAWWRALGGGEEPFTLRVDAGTTDALGRPDVRTLRLWDTTVDDGYVVDPAIAGSAEYAVTADAESAYWTGPEVVETFAYQAGDEQDYYGGTAGGGFGPDFYISGGTQFVQASIANPGDVPAYPRYRITAPFDGVTVGVAGEVIVMPFAQTASQQVIIDTDPRVQSIVDAQGIDLWPLVGTAIDPIFAPIPPGASIPLTIAMGSADIGSAVQVALTPLYRRAW